MTPEKPISVDEVEAARGRVSSTALTTPLVRTPGLANLTGSDVMLKLETVQPTGSFKIRGAASKVLSLTEEQRRRGVVTASTGNHGRAVAHVAARHRVAVAVCVSENVPSGKVEALEKLGCEVLIGGDSQSAAFGVAEELVQSRGMTLVHPFDDREVIAGQGTIGLEICEQTARPLDVIVPLSGGGLVAGIAVAVKARSPSSRVIAVSMERAAAMAESLKAGHPVEIAEEPTLADSLQGGIGLDNRHTFEMVQRLVDEVVLVGEDDIWDAMRWAFHHQGLILEGAAAVGIAALLTGSVQPDDRAVVVCSGQNLESEQLTALAASSTVDR